jgi:hypothetical protein
MIMPMIPTDRRRATDTSTARAWAVRSVYGLFVLAMLFYFQNRTMEQERIHYAANGFFPQVVSAVEKANQWYFQKTEKAFDAYPIDYNGKYFAIAASVLKRATAYSAHLSGIVELPSQKERSDAFRKAVPDLIAMRDTLIAACDKDPDCVQLLTKIVPAADDAYWKTAVRLDATCLSNILQLQNALAGDVAMRYLYDRVGGSETCGGWGGSPDMMNLQMSPAVGEWYEAGFFLREYTYIPTSIRFKINDKPYPEKDGAVHYQQRFTRPGKQRLQVEVDVLVTRDSTVLATSVQDFEINVLPRPLDFHNLKSN